MRPIILTAVLLVLCLSGFPAASASDDKMAPVACKFASGRSWTYGAGKFKSRKPSALSFEIADIDLEAQSAKLVTKNGTGVLRVVRAINANHFIEVVTEGFLNLTTVYDKDPKTGLHPAVHSRHFGLVGQPVFAQYTGFCRPQ